MSNITYSDGLTFEKGFTPLVETVQARAGTERLMLDIQNGETARTIQRQAETSQYSDDEEDHIIGEELITEILTSEVEINFAIPTPGEITEEDLERNELDTSHQRDLQQKGGDPSTKLGGKP